MSNLTNYQINKHIYKQYLEYLLKYFFFNLKYEIIIDNPYVAYNLFYPLPTELIIDNYSIENRVIQNIDNNNIYSFYGTINKNRILFGNRKLPKCDKYPIPFTFPVVINNQIELLNSNVYYFELTILENIRDPWLEESISIGYGSLNLPINTNPGWNNESFGYHLDDGSFQCDQIFYKNVGPKYNQNDVFGAGIIFLSKNYYRPFFTFNGTLINLEFFNNLYIEYDIVPIVGYDHSNRIKLNFGQEEFKFDIKNYLHNNKVISNENNFIKSEYNMTNIITKNLIMIKSQNNLNVPLFSIINDNTNLNLPIIAQNSNQISEFIFTIFNQN
jgi:hypothetical protein